MRLLLVSWLFLLVASSTGWAACGGSVGVRSGDTVGSIARDCGINVEKLKQANPGLNERTLRNGTFVTVPRDPLPSPRAYGGNRGISTPPGRVIVPHFGTGQSAATRSGGVTDPQVRPDSR